MLLRKCKVGWIGLLAVAILCTNAPAQTLLRYKFKSGEKLHYVMEQKMNMEMAIMNMNVVTATAQTFDITWDVKSVDSEGNAKVTERFDRVRFTMDAAQLGGKIEFDSKDGKLPEGLIGGIIGPLFKAMAGAEFEATIDGRGRVSNIKVPEALTEAFKKAPGAAAGGDLFSEEGLKHLISNVPLVLPEKAVVKGDKWDQEVEVKMQLGKMKNINAYIYEGPTEKNGVKLEQVAAKPNAKIEADPNAQFNMKIKSQEAKGTAYFNNDAGRLADSEVTQNMEMAVSAMGTDFTIKLEQKISFKLQDKAGP
jgi:hypothetical protein